MTAVFETESVAVATGAYTPYCETYITKSSYDSPSMESPEDLLPFNLID